MIKRHLKVTLTGNNKLWTLRKLQTFVKNRINLMLILLLNFQILRNSLSWHRNPPIKSAAEVFLKVVYNNNKVYTITVIFINLSIMLLESPPMDKCYESFEAFKADVQQHAHKQRYAIIIKHSKKDKKNEYIIKVIFMCDQGWKQHISLAITHLNITSQNIECSFACYAVNKKCAGNWILVVTNSDHNHFKLFHLFVHAIHCIANHNSSQMTEIQHRYHAKLVSN